MPKSSMASRMPWARRVLQIGVVTLADQDTLGQFDHQVLGRQSGLGQFLAGLARRTRASGTAGPTR